MNHAVLRTLLLAEIAAVVFGLVFWLSLRPSRPGSSLGMRGLARQKALLRSPTWATFEPFVRWTGVRVGHLIGDRRHNRLDTELTHSGDFLGLSPAEYFGSSLLGSAFVGSVGLAAAKFFNVPLPWLAALVGIVVGYAVPRAIVDSARVTRFVAIGRGLPSAIDLMSLSMSAGLDFPGALSQVVEKSKANEALRSELAYVLQQLRLGTTRATALRGFAERVPLESVRELTQALLQADERGNPVAAVIEVQASTARTRRSNLAEKAAEDMRSKMILPVMMIVGVNLTIIAVPSSMMIESFAK